MNIPLAKLHISPLNTRQPDPKDPTIAELAASLSANGQTANILVRPHPKKKGQYEIAAGARRRVAAEVAGLKSLDANIKEMGDEEFQEIILLDNIQRQDPEPRAEAELLQRLAAKGLRTPKQIADRIGKSESWVARRMKLLSVVPAALKAWVPGKELGHFSVEMMEFLGSLPAETQNTFLKDDYRARRVDSRRKLEEEFQRELCRLDHAPFKLDDPRFFNPATKCGPGCGQDSSKEKTLFDFKDGNKKESCGRCLSPTCFNTRMAIWRGVRYKELCGTDGDLPVYGQISGSEIAIGTKKVKPHWEVWDLQKKDSPGAKRVILIEKDGSLRNAWIPKQKGAGSKGKKDDATPVSDEEKREEKTAMLQGKRWVSIQPALLDAVRKSKRADLTVPIDHLVAVFGLPFHEKSSSYAPVDDGLWDYINNPTAFPLQITDEAAYDKEDTEPEDVAVREDAIWPAVKVVLAGLVAEPNRVSDGVKYANCYRNVAKIIGFDIDAAKHAADLEILPPKSWGKVDPHTLEPVTIASVAPEKKTKAPVEFAKGATTKEKILSVLEQAGPEGMKLTEIAAATRMPAANVAVWLSTSGKKLNKRLATGCYTIKCEKE